jgi:hypothetical protein
MIEDPLTWQHYQYRLSVLDRAFRYLFILANFYVVLACGSRRTVDQAEPTPPTVRGVVSSQKTDWQGVPSTGISKSPVVNPIDQNTGTPTISIFFLRQPLTTSDGEDYSEESDIKSWFGPEPVER